MPRETNNQRATITEVAKYLDVSKSTVSRAFNRPRMLLPETVSRVREAAEILGYSPSKTAMALATGLHSTIALVVPDIANPFFPRLIRAAQSRANERGMSCLLGDSDEAANRELEFVTEFTPDVRGFVLMSSRLPDETLRELASKTKLVLINRDVEGIMRVLLDTTVGLTEALESLYSLGHRSFAYLGGPHRSWSHAQRLSAVQAFAASHAVSVNFGQAVPATFAGGSAAAVEALSSDPTAFLCFDDVVAQGAIAALSRLGFRVPQDISVVGCDDTLASTIHPTTATIRLDYQSAGSAAIDLVLDVIDVESNGDATADAQRLVFDGEFLPGETMGAAS
ncbi:MAG: LacI family transcriptional regulator [Subtercola sp.]|nr:LacI family transcriptional regulator [Subtercola sp.]